MLFCPSDRTAGNKIVSKAAEPRLPDTRMQIRRSKNMHTHRTETQSESLRRDLKASTVMFLECQCMRTLPRGSLGAFVSHTSLLRYSHWLREYIRLRKTSGIISSQDFSSPTSGSMTCLTMRSSRIKKVAFIRLQVLETQLLHFNEQNLFLKLFLLPVSNVNTC